MFAKRTVANDASIAVQAYFHNTEMKEKQTTRGLSKRDFFIPLNYRNISRIFLLTIFQAFETRAVKFSQTIF